MRGHTQKYVAISLGVKAPSVSDWENGKTNPTLENLISLAKLLEVSTDMLLGIEPIKNGDTPKGDMVDFLPVVSDFERNIITAYRSASHDTQRAVCNVLGIESGSIAKAN